MSIPRCSRFSATGRRRNPTNEMREHQAASYRLRSCNRQRPARHAVGTSRSEHSPVGFPFPCRRAALRLPTRFHPFLQAEPAEEPRSRIQSRYAFDFRRVAFSASLIGKLPSSPASNSPPAELMGFTTSGACFDASSFARRRAIIIGQAENLPSLARSVRLRR